MTQQFARGEVDPLALAEALAATGGDRSRIVWEDPRTALVVNFPGWQPQLPPVTNGQQGDSPADRQAARAWARSRGIPVADRGRVSAEIIARWHQAGRP